MHVTVDHTEQVSPSVMTFWLKPETPMRYIAGQFVEMLLPGSHDARGPRRWFTLSSSPTEPLLGITTRFAEVDSSSFKQALQSLEPGTQIHISEPMGDFVLPKNETVPLIFIANGIGVTPMRSMTTWLTDTGGNRDITMLYAGKSEADMPFKAFFADYYGSAFTALTGRKLTADDILAVADEKPDSLIYLAGPEPMVEAIGRDLAAAGIESHRIVIDFFSGYSDV